MKLYVRDGAWNGAIVFAADSAEEAAKMAKRSGRQIKIGNNKWRDFTAEDFTEYELKSGFILETDGDV